MDLQFITAIYFQIALKTQIYSISLQSKSNVKTSSRRLKPDACQTHQHKTDRLTPDSRQTQTPPGPTIGAIVALFVFLAARVATVRTSFQFFSASHERRTRTVKCDGHWLLGVEVCFTSVLCRETTSFLVSDI
jgi:hypothetical protein